MRMQSQEKTVSHEPAGIQQEEDVGGIPDPAAAALAGVAALLGSHAALVNVVRALTNHAMNVNVNIPAWQSRPAALESLSEAANMRGLMHEQRLSQHEHKIPPE